MCRIIRKVTRPSARKIIVTSVEARIAVECEPNNLKPILNLQNIPEVLECLDSYLISFAIFGRVRVNHRADECRVDWLNVEDK
jgi:hypothetical protein